MIGFSHHLGRKEKRRYEIPTYKLGIIGGKHFWGTIHIHPAVDATMREAYGYNSKAGELSFLLNSQVSSFSTY